MCYDNKCLKLAKFRYPQCAKITSPEMFETANCEIYLFAKKPGVQYTFKFKKYIYRFGLEINANALKLLLLNVKTDFCIKNSRI